MSSTYTGDSSAVTARQAVDITCPVDGDARNAAAQNTPDQAIADAVAYLMENALLGNPDTTGDDNDNDDDAAPRFANGIDSADKIDLSNGAASIADRRLLINDKCGTAYQNKVRMYRNVDKLEIVVGAYYSGSGWTPDKNTSDTASMLVLQKTYARFYTKAHDGNSFWSDGDWVEATVGTTRAVASVALGATPSISYSKGNIASVGYQNSGGGVSNDLLRITFTSAMPDANYVVVPSIQTGGNTHVVVFARATTYCDIWAMTASSGTAVDLTSLTTSKIMVTIDGN